MGAMIRVLLMAIAMMESGGNSAAIGDTGRAIGVLQIHRSYVDDVNRIAGTNFTYADRLDPQKSRTMANIYLVHYGRRYERLTGKPATREILAAIHHGGPDGWRKASCLEYARRAAALAMDFEARNMD